MSYIAGYNMPGCLPEESAHIEDADWHEALQFLVDTIELWWDQDYEICETSKDKLVVDGKYLEAHASLNSATSFQEFHILLTDGNDTPWEFWITETT